MKTLSDEILNRYIDGELDKVEMNEVEETIKNSIEDRIRLKALQEADHSLRDLKVYEVKSNFTSLVMKRIQRGINSKQEQKKFIVGIITVFILMCLIIVGIVGYEVIKNINAGAPTALRDSVKYVTSASEFITSIFNSRNMSIVGGIFSFGLIISAWFFFDYSKMVRKAGK